MANANHRRPELSSRTERGIQVLLSAKMGSPIQQPRSPHVARNGTKISLPPCRWHLHCFLRGTWHSRHAAASRSLSLRALLLRGGQSERLAHLGINLRQCVLVIFEELARIFAPLADAFALVAEPRSRLLDKIVIHRNVKQIAFSRNTFAIKNVELGLAEGRRHLVLYDFHARPATGLDVAFLDRGNAADIN